eukprot:574476-Pyramimonas_sp.AAC.1
MILGQDRCWCVVGALRARHGCRQAGDGEGAAHCGPLAGPEASPHREGLRWLEDRCAPWGPSGASGGSRLRCSRAFVTAGVT